MSDWLTPEQVVELAKAHGVVSPLNAHGFFGGRISVGWVLRILVRNGRTFQDALIFEPEPVIPDWCEADVAGGRILVTSFEPFSITSGEGPVILVDRILPSVMSDPVAWVREAVSTAIQQDKPIPRTPMNDAEFWDLISLLEGRPEHAGLERLSDVLSQRPYVDRLKFYDALAIKLRELDDPLNTVAGDPDAVQTIDAERSLAYRCEIVAQGRDFFELRAREPYRGDGDSGLWGQGLLLAPTRAGLDNGTPPAVEIATGSNPERWPEPRVPAVTPPTTASPGPFSYEVQMSNLGLAPRLPVILGHFVAYAATEDRVREIIGCFMFDDYRLEQARIEALKVVTDRLAPDERLYDDVIVDSVRFGGVGKGLALALIVRRSKLDLPSYAAHFYRGERL